MMTNTNTGRTITVSTRGCDLSVVSEATKLAWQRLYGYTAMQVWTWRGGEALVAKDWSANYGRGETVVIVRTGGTKRGAVRVLNVDCFRDAMSVMGLSYRFCTGTRPRQPRTSGQQHRATLARAIRASGGMFRTLRARPRQAVAA